jgi:hypothetical protein
MLKKEEWQELAKRGGLEADKLQEAIASEKEETLNMSTVTILTDEELKLHNEKIGKSSAKTGAKTIIEMDVKDLREKYGLEFEGKTIENLMNSFAVKEAKIAPDKKYEIEKEKVLRLQKTYDTDIDLKSKENESLNKTISDYKNYGELTKHLPELTGISQHDFITIAKTQADFDYDEDNNFVVKQNGKTLLDKMENPIKPTEWLSDFAKKKEWVVSNGRGGNDEPGNGSEFKSINDVFAHMKKNNIDPHGEVGKKLIIDFENTKN